MLLVASLLATANQFIGNNINCMVEGIPDPIMNSYCWIQGTYTVPSDLPSLTTRDVISPGATAPTAMDNSENDVTAYSHDEEDYVGHAWYQWVCFVLFIQAMMCYFPHYLWKAMEGGKLSMIIKGLEKPSIEEKDDEEKQRRNVVEYLIKTRGTHRRYAYKFFFCEVLNLLNILLQAYLMDEFFGGQFRTYGTEVLRISQLPIEDRYDHMAKIFPRITKCNFNHYGPSGTLEKKDALCILSINIINEKIFIVLWFWYVFLVVWTAIHLMYKLLLIFSSDCQAMSLRSNSRPISQNGIKNVMYERNFGDYFILSQMSNYIDPPAFLKIMEDLKKNTLKRRESVRVSSGPTNV